MKTVLHTLAALALGQMVLSAQTPVITNQPTNQTVWEDCNVTFAVGVAGSGPFTYQWQFNLTKLTNGIITTVAGGGNGGDNGPAVNASLNGPTGVAVDGQGNLFIADTGNQRIRKVGAGGIITTVAGNGTAGYSGDGTAATSASLNLPYGVAVDGSGNLFTADDNNNRVRKVSANGIITTLAGTGTNAYAGDGGAATNASVNYPQGVAVDGYGNVFIADTYNSCVRKVGTNGIISTIAGGTYGYSADGGVATNSSLYWPTGVAVDGSGSLFLADLGRRIREVDTNGIISTVAGRGGTPLFSGDGGPATNASVYNPSGVAVDAIGDLFIADTQNQRIRKVDTRGIITTVAGNGVSGPPGDGGQATNAAVALPFGAAVDSFGNLFIVDTGENRIRKVTNTQGPALALNNVSTSSAGSYRVIVTGSAGSVTSSIATLTVVASPLIYGTVRNRDGTVSLSLVSRPKSTNVVLCATNLSPPTSWLPLSTNIAGVVGNWQYTDAEAASSQWRFYRCVTR